MAGVLSRLNRSPRFEPDGQTHRRDCECVRCDVGFGPTERQRASARRRDVERRGVDRAAYEWARRKERERLARGAAHAYVERQLAMAEQQVRVLHEAREHSESDLRLARLLQLRRAGRSLHDAFDEVERRSG